MPINVFAHFSVGLFLFFNFKRSLYLKENSALTIVHIVHSSCVTLITSMVFTLSFLIDIGDPSWSPCQRPPQGLGWRNLWWWWLLPPGMIFILFCYKSGFGILKQLIEFSDQKVAYFGRIESDRKLKLLCSELTYCAVLDLLVFSCLIFFLLKWKQLQLLCYCRV